MNTTQLVVSQSVIITFDGPIACIFSSLVSSSFSTGAHSLPLHSLHEGSPSSSSLLYRWSSSLFLHPISPFFISFLFSTFLSTSFLFSSLLFPPSLTLLHPFLPHQDIGARLFSFLLFLSTYPYRNPHTLTPTPSPTLSPTPPPFSQPSHPFYYSNITPVPFAQLPFYTYNTTIMVHLFAKVAAVATLAIGLLSSTADAIGSCESPFHPLHDPLHSSLSLHIPFMSLLPHSAYFSTPCLVPCSSALFLSQKICVQCSVWSSSCIAVFVCGSLLFLWVSLHVTRDESALFFIFFSYHLQYIPFQFNYFSIDRQLLALCPFFSLSSVFPSSLSIIRLRLLLKAVYMVYIS